MREDARCHGQRGGQAGVVEPEPVRVAAQRRPADLDPEAAVGGVAGHREREPERRVTVTAGLSASLFRKLPFGSRSGCGAGNVVSGLATLPVENAADAVTILKVEPGG